jgi:hypothetical protein
MPVKTPWWFCGECGHKNKPRILRHADNSTSYADWKLCEQCGDDGTQSEHSVDYQPQ